MSRGRSATSVHSETSDMDFDGTGEGEMIKLQRQFRILEGDRAAYSIQSQEIIRKQRQEISKLCEDREELLRSLHVAECQARRRSDSQDAQSIRALLEQLDDLDEQMEQERQTQTELKQEIMTMEKKMAEVRRGEVTASQSRMSQARHTHKTTRTLENKLDRALICFNKQQTRNSLLRDEIESLCVERVRFQQLRGRLDKKLQDIRGNIGEVINMSSTAYDVRVEAQTKMTTMKEKAVKDFAQYTAEIKELEKVIDHEQRLKEFMTTKCNERTLQDDGHEFSRRQEMKELRKTESGAETLETLEEVFQKIQRVTGEDDLETLVTNFIRVEDRNFALFNYVNEQNTNIEMLREQINQIQEEREQFRVESLQKEEEYQMVLKQVKDQQRECERQTQQYEAQANDSSKILDQIKTGVDSMFTEIGCDRALDKDMLDFSAGITDSNIMTYLSLVEQKTNELLTIQAFINSKDQEKKCDSKVVAQFLLGPKPEIQRQAMPSQAPVTRDNYDAEESQLTDEEDRPLTQDELRQSIMRGVLCKKASLDTEEGRDVKTANTATPSSSGQRSQDV